MTTASAEVESAAPLPQFSHDWVKGVPYTFKGLTIIIEFFEGDVRVKTKGNGSVVSNIMPAAYGFILGTTDQHGEEIDVYIASLPDEDTDIFVIDQIHPDSGLFDEHKVMIGFNTVEEACMTYKDVFGDGSGENRLGAITVFSGNSFKDWMTSEGYSVSPASKFGHPDVTPVIMKGITNPPMPPQLLTKPRDEAGGVIIGLPDLSKGPKIKPKARTDGGMEYTMCLFSALETRTWSNVVDTFCRILDLATEKDIMHIRIASPGGSVFLMGRIVSAIKATKAKVITYAQGCVASAANTIFVAGHERHILPGAYFMQHMSSQVVGGKSSDISAKSTFCVEYITRHLAPALEIGLFTDEEISDMINKSADIYISGREAISRIGKISPAVQG